MYRALADAIRDAEAQGKSLSQVALERESEDQGRSIDDIRSSLSRALEIMRCESTIDIIQRGRFLLFSPDWRRRNRFRTRK